MQEKLKRIKDQKQQRVSSPGRVLDFDKDDIIPAK